MFRTLDVRYLHGNEQVCGCWVGFSLRNHRITGRSADVSGVSDSRLLSRCGRRRPVRVCRETRRRSAAAARADEPKAPNTSDAFWTGGAARLTQEESMESFAAGILAHCFINEMNAV